MSNVIKLRKSVKGVRVSKVTAPFIAQSALGGEAGENPSSADFAAGLPLAGLKSPAISSAEVEYQRGYAAGKEDERFSLGAEQDRALIEEQRRIDTLMISMQEQVMLLTSRLENEAFRFALAVAERIVKREVALDSDVTVRQIREAIQRVVGVESVKLRVHPLDEVLLRQNRDQVLQGADSIHEMVIEQDDKIDRGGCIIESAAGNVDARIATQLKQIESALFGAAPTA